MRKLLWLILTVLVSCSHPPHNWRFTAVYENDSVHADGDLSLFSQFYDTPSKGWTALISDWTGPMVTDTIIRGPWLVGGPFVIWYDTIFVYRPDW